MKHALAVLTIALNCILAGCTLARPAVSVRPLYQADEKWVKEPRLVGEWTPVKLTEYDLEQEKAEHWIISAGDDGCYEANNRKKDEKNPGHDWGDDFYRVCLVSLDNKLFFDQQLRKTVVERGTLDVKQLGSELSALHMVGRLWPQQDLIRVTRLKADWLNARQPEVLRFDADYSTIFTGSTAQLREIMTQHSEDPDAMDAAWYLCHPDADCSVRIAEEEVKLQPNNTDVLRGAALIYTGAGQYDKAIALLNKCSEIVPADERAVPRMLTGLVRLRRRDFAGARGDFDAAGKLDATGESQTHVIFLIGVSYFLEGKYSDAHTAFASLKGREDASSASLRILMDYASLVRMGSRQQAESFLAEETAGFVGDRDETLFLLGAAGRVDRYSVEDFTDYDLRVGKGIVYALVRLAKDDPKSAREALERSLNVAIKWMPQYLAAEIELERLDGKAASH